MFTIAFHNIDPVAIEIGSFPIYWYAISYVVGILGCIFFAQKLSTKYSLGITKSQLDTYMTYLILGIIIGGRLGYIIFYDPVRYIENPIEIFQTRQGGMSFHGGLLGFILSGYLFCRIYKIKYLKLMDLAAVVAPFAILLGRIANFINGELYGRATNISWAMIFPESDGMPRHPSQLYEAFLEGIILQIIMYYASKRINISGYTTGIFLIFYSSFRIICEFFREPDLHLGFIIAEFSMGQLLSLPLLLLGIYFWMKSSCQSSPISEK